MDLRKGLGLAQGHVAGKQLSPHLHQALPAPRLKLRVILLLLPSTVAVTPHLGSLTSDLPCPVHSLSPSQLISRKYQSALPNSAQQLSVAPYCLPRTEQSLTPCTDQSLTPHRPKLNSTHRPKLNSTPEAGGLCTLTSSLCSLSAGILSNLCSPHLQHLLCSTSPQRLPCKPSPSPSLYEKPLDFLALRDGSRLSHRLTVRTPPLQ